MRMVLVALAIVCSSSIVDAQQCKKGKPCGNSCIARNKTCRVGPGTAVWAPGADRSEPTSPAPVATTAAEREPPAITFVTPARYCIVSVIVDGDTFRCEDGTRVRLLLIDAPEMGQGAFGTPARARLAELLPTGDPVALEFDVDQRDRYGRTLAYAYGADGEMVNEAMVRSGYAVVSVYQPNVKYVEVLRAAAEKARAEKRGLWSGSAFDCLPAEHRAGRCR